MLEPAPDVGVGCQVEDEVGATHGPAQGLGVERVSLDQREALVALRVAQKLGPPGRRVVVSDDAASVAQQTVDDVAADEPAPPLTKTFWTQTHRQPFAVAASDRFAMIRNMSPRSRIATWSRCSAFAELRANRRAGTRQEPVDGGVVRDPGLHRHDVEFRLAQKRRKRASLK